MHRKRKNNVHKTGTCLCTVQRNATSNLKCSARVMIIDVITSFYVLTSDNLLFVASYWDLYRYRFIKTDRLGFRNNKET
jgi:hypothetical protein